ncbi:hypothetical protein GpartN1_g3068.t1 [Galdieria partita]|uniref:Uncharacterized protein n=1 Tax=Galdieria partita TaxID=83374 RepID=A0A9C7PXF2_9RHOD|nr:hypothetical protein GpartN1_g3068.t1 [Galdieria partita]
MTNFLRCSSCGLNCYQKKCFYFGANEKTFKNDSFEKAETSFLLVLYEMFHHAILQQRGKFKKILVTSLLLLVCLYLCTSTINPFSATTTSKQKDPTQSGFFESRQTYQNERETQASDDKVIDSAGVNFSNQATTDLQTSETSSSKSGFEEPATEEAVQAESTGNSEKVNFESFQQGILEVASKTRDSDMISSDTSLPADEKVANV